MQDVEIDGVVCTRKTTLDYVIVPLQQQSRVLELVIDANSGLDSDHRPVRVSVRWNHGPAQAIKRSPARERWRLREMQPRDWDGFSRACGAAMTPMAVGNTSGDDLWGSWKQTLLATSTREIGKKRVYPNSKPWFDIECRALRKERLAAGAAVRSTSGSAQEAARARLNYLRRKWRATIRRKRLAHRERTFRSIERAQGNGGVFAKLWKSHTRSVAGRTGVADAVLAEDGKVACDSIGVLNAWRAYAEKLGKADCIGDAEPVGCGGDRASTARRDFDDEFARQVLREVAAVSCVDGSVPELDRDVTYEDVHRALVSMPAGKAADGDGIVVELLQNMGIAVEMALVRVFNQVWSNQAWPDDWCRAYRLPLLKGDGSQLDPSNYRLLSISSVPSKVFEKVLDARIQAWSERIGALTDLQGGFRGGRSTVDQLFALNEITAMRREDGDATFLAFIDVTKAYDRVWRPGLWYKLQQLGLGGRCLQMLRAMYAKVTRTVAIRGEYTESFEVGAGVAQGAVLSPFLYAVYINGLHAALRDSGLGVFACGRRVPLLLYADDVVLLARDSTELQLMLDVVSKYARQWRFSTNHGKSKVVVVGTPRCRSLHAGARFVLSGRRLDIVPEYKYLGTESGKQSGGRGRWNTFWSVSTAK